MYLEKLEFYELNFDSMSNESHETHDMHHYSQYSQNSLNFTFIHQYFGSNNLENQACST